MSILSSVWLSRRPGEFVKSRTNFINFYLSALCC